MLIPCYSKGNPDIPDEVYKAMYDKWRAEVEANEGHTGAVFGHKKAKKKVIVEMHKNV